MMPPNQMGPNRRQNDYQHYGQHPPPMQAYYPQPPQFYNPHAPHYPQPWYQQQPYPGPPYGVQPYQQAPRFPPQYAPMPHPQQHAPPMVVSSQPQPHYPQYNHTPHTPFGRSHIPTPQVTHAPMQPAAPPYTPSIHSVPRQSPAPSAVSERVQLASPPPAPSVDSRPSTAAIEDPEPIPTIPSETPTEAPQEVPEPVPVAATREPFTPPLPWLSMPDQPFPPPSRRRRKRRGHVALSAPSFQMLMAPEAAPATEEAVDAGEATEEQTESQASTVAAPSEHETPATSQAPSEAGEAPATPSLPVQTAPATTHVRVPTRPVVPIIPKVPASAARKQSVASKAEAALDATPVVSTAETATTESATESTAAEPAGDAAPAPAPHAPPKSWADLVRSKASVANVPSATTTNGVVSGERSAVSSATNMAEAVRAYTVNSAEKVSFIKPRGLVNQGNMCYMNSVLQTLAFCTPFYDFIDMVGKRAAHSFKSDTPLLDAMILFLREYPVIDSASSVEKLRMRLKSEELEQFGENLTPVNVYDAIKRLNRFASFKRGHQQDAEEFLIVLLEQLHDECVKVINSLPISALDAAEPLSPASERSSVTDAGWQEVGPKQKAAITHTSGHTYNDTPITKIFGGTLRSELRVPGKKTSVTFQPYQPLQLDIGSSDVQNIIDAMKALTRSETIQGDFNSSRGPGVAATKQIFIETLPPVLILHLKRFEYNEVGGTTKIWKKIGYPLELTIPKEVFPQQKRGQISLSGLPRYRLEGVIYHHGKNASSGHYTVDLRRQEGREWIRIDDTIIRRLRAEDVAEGGAEEDPKVLAKALEEHRKDSNSKNLFDQFGSVDEDNQNEGGWNTAQGTKKWSTVANGTGTATPSSVGAKTPRKENVKDNKVAYILFYRRI